MISKYYYLSLLYVIFISLVPSTLASVKANDHYHEELVLQPLATGHLYAHFQFTTYWNVDISDKDACMYYCCHCLSCIHVD